MLQKYVSTSAVTKELKRPLAHFWFCYCRGDVTKKLLTLCSKISNDNDEMYDIFKLWKRSMKTV